jgi:predicted metal-dependent hydrolase
MIFRKKPLPLREEGCVEIGGEQVAFSVTRSAKRKRTIAFRMEADASLRVLAPRSASLNAVVKILQNRAPWIVKHLSLQKLSPVCDYTDGSVTPYMGHAMTIKITQGGGASSCVVVPHQMHVHVPQADMSPGGLRAEVKLEISLLLKKRARALFKKRLDIWAARMGLDYKKFVLADAERRWGSCSADNIIRLNWRLMLAPLGLIDYVVVHELAHVRHKDHSPRFWKCVEQSMPDWRARRAALRRIESQLAL